MTYKELTEKLRIPCDIELRIDNESQCRFKSDSRISRMFNDRIVSNYFITEDLNLFSSSKGGARIVIDLYPLDDDSEVNEE